MLYQFNDKHILSGVNINIVEYKLLAIINYIILVEL
jgi:hypothetical protein